MVAAISNGYFYIWSEFNGRLSPKSTLIGRRVILTASRRVRCEFVKLHLQPFIRQAQDLISFKIKMTELTIGEIYIFVLWFITVEFLKIVWLLYILFLIWLLIHYVNNYCIEINFVFN